MVKHVDGWPSGYRLPLLILARLPSGWSALVALSAKDLHRNPTRALKYADRAVRMNQSVWQGHYARVRATTELGLDEQGRHARLVGLLLTSPTSAVRLVETWFPHIDSNNRTLACQACQVPHDQLIQVLEEVISLSRDPDRAARAVQYLADAYGTATIVGLDHITDILPETMAVAVATSMRQAGEVRPPIDLLRQYDLSEAVLKVLRGAEQDAAILSGRFALNLPEPTKLLSRPESSLYLLHNSLPQKSGGYATRSHGLIRGVRGTGWDMIPVTRPGFPSQRYVFDQDPDTPAIELVDGVPYHRILGPVDSQPRSDLQGFIDLYVDALGSLIGGYRPQLIHAASNWWNGLAAVAAARRYGIPAIYEVRGLWEVTRSSRVPGWEKTERYEADAQYEAEAARLADRVIVITNGLKNEMVRRGVDANKIRVVPNAVDIDQFNYQSRDHDLATSLGIADEVVVGFAGTFTFYEGIDDLLRAGARIRGHCATPFRFLFVGDGPAVEDLRKLAADLDLTDLCIFTGRVPHRDVSRYLSLVAITPFPRKALPVSEMVSPLKPLESMAAGSVVLASDVQALEEMVPTGAGLLFAKGDIDDLASKLQALIEDESIRDKLTSNAYRWVRQYRSWRYVAANLADVYRELSA